VIGFLLAVAAAVAVIMVVVEVEVDMFMPLVNHFLLLLLVEL